MGNLANIAGIKEINKDANERDMVKHLAEANRKIVKDLAKARDIGGDLDDLQTEDLMITRIQVYQKTIWMLESYLG